MRSNVEFPRDVGLTDSYVTLATGKIYLKLSQERDHFMQPLNMKMRRLHDSNRELFSDCIEKQILEDTGKTLKAEDRQIEKKGREFEVHVGVASGGPSTL